MWKANRGWCFLKLEPDASLISLIGFMFIHSRSSILFQMDLIFFLCCLQIPFKKKKKARESWQIISMVSHAALSAIGIFSVVYRCFPKGLSTEIWWAFPSQHVPTATSEPELNKVMDTLNRKAAAFSSIAQSILFGHPHRPLYIFGLLWQQGWWEHVEGSSLSWHPDWEISSLGNPAKPLKPC